MNNLQPFALKDVPNLIESGIFPVQKLSFEAQRERKSVHGQILPSIGAYWKGRKPLILVRAVVLGLLLPKTGSDRKDLQIFEKLLSFDDHGLARRALARRKLTPDCLAQSNMFGHQSLTYFEPSSSKSRKFQWKKSITEEVKLDLICGYLSSLESYVEKSQFCSRPDEVNQKWLYEPIWSSVRNHYCHWGVTANSFEELVEQIGILRFGKRPVIGDPFAGGGSIPFESARLGCNVYAGDLNPVACMLTWGAFNIIGVSDSKRRALSEEIENVREQIFDEVQRLGFEKSANSEKAKAYLFCHETICPQTGWTIPISGSWVISEKKSLIAKMVPNYTERKFNLELKHGASSDELKLAGRGTTQKGKIIYELKGKKYENSIRSLRGDYTDDEGNSKNNLRKWERWEIEPRSSDLFTERLYAIQWFKEAKNGNRSETYFSTPTEFDFLQEARLGRYVKENVILWQSQGWIPEIEIEEGYNTDQPIRERGWQYWHHFFNPRQLLLQKIIMEHSKNSKLPAELLVLAIRAIDYNNRGCRWAPGVSIPVNLFDNQALNTLWNYGVRSSSNLISKWKGSSLKFEPIHSESTQVYCQPANNPHPSDIYVTDPPYADAVHYHEITEIFISWLQKDLPIPFNEWTWDSRRSLAIKGSGIEFRQSMIEAYREMTSKMSDHGYQCVMFTHSSIKVWTDITNILWASGLQISSAWCVATETSTSIREGNYIQGTVLLVLKKRQAESRTGYKQIILSKITGEVENQVKLMMNLNEETKNQLGETALSSADIQLAGQAAALKVLTSYTSIDGQDVSAFALRSQDKDSSNVVEDIVSRAVDIANSMLIPDILKKSVWDKLTGLERYYLHMMEINTSQLDFYQRYAKLHRVTDYYELMSNTKANTAKLKLISEFNARDLSVSKEIGRTWLGQLIIALQQLVCDTVDPVLVLTELQNSVSDFLLAREDLINVLEFIEVRSPESEIREAATLLKGQLRNIRAFNQ